MTFSIYLWRRLHAMIPMRGLLPFYGETWGKDEAQYIDAGYCLDRYDLGLPGVEPT